MVDSRGVMARVLVIEDEADLRDVLAYNLTQAGHQVALASNGRDGLRLASEKRPDVVLLDLMLPDMPGTEVCRALRATTAPSSRIVMLTAKGEEIDRVLGFELGADDYVTKPFSVRELLLRIKGLLRRSAPPEGGSVVQVGGLRVDKLAHRVTVDGEEITLTALEFKLLVTLLDRRDRVQTRGVLLNDVWGLDAETESRTVDTHVKRLREKLGVAGQYIETVRGVGYRVSRAAGDPTSASG